MRDFSQPGRSLVFSEHAMAATSSPVATLCALDILKQGGNAVDAAVAASAVLCVAEPAMTGLGGDCFAIVAEPDGTLSGWNGAGRSAAAATPDWLKSSGLKTIEPHSIHAVTVPGAVDAWQRLLVAHGRMSLADVLQPAIALAERGVFTQPRVAMDWLKSRELLRHDSGARRHYLKVGKAPQAGERMVYPALAKTLRAIATDGPDAFYRGAIAEEIVATLQARGSLLTLDDFAATEASLVKPIHTGFAGHTIHEVPPPGQGLTVLIALNILSCFGVKNLDALGPQRRHLEIEAMKRAWHLRNRHIADPDFATVPVTDLLSNTMAQRLAASIDPHRASDLTVSLPSSDTVYLCVVDQDRRAVSFINSIYWAFGSGIVTMHSGITLQNRGAGFVCDPQHPNCIGPSKRPLHTLIPAVSKKAGKVDMVFGVMGGDFQPMGHVNVVLNTHVFGMDPQAALDMARLVPRDGLITYESALETSVQRDLARMGHRLQLSDEPLGGGQVIAIDHRSGCLSGGSDPRKDGFAAGF